MIQPLRTVAGCALDLEIWLVAGAVLAGMLSNRLLPLAPLAALAFWLARLLADRRLSLRPAPLVWLVWGLVVAGWQVAEKTG